MSYNDFKTLNQIHKELGISICDKEGLYTSMEPAEVSPWFLETMKRAYPKAVRINTESARQSLIVNHVLMELEQHVMMSFFLQNSFNVDAEKGLTGNPDGLISKSENQLYITSPVVVLVEAKKSDLSSGLAQCVAEMEAARIFNEQEGDPVVTIYGVVTDGVLWQFLSLQDSIATIDSFLYPFEDGRKIISILKSFLYDT